ncbi:MAG: DUF2277 domain-containing protein [Frankiaceae bacterium]|nr:DUF2277 domain-containing protein [Frankiaceae bacterium]
MCRSIRTLRAAEPTTGDVTAAARQYVRKLSGYRVPSKANQDVFEQAIADIAAVTERMLGALGSAPVEGPERPPVRNVAAG